MIAPHELKNKTFTKAVRGYAPIEVDQYFDFLIEKYTEAYKTATELEQKFNQLEAKYSELSNEEASIRSAILKAQKLGEAIINNAKEEAKEKEVELAKRCDQIIADAKEKVQEEKNNILKLRRLAIDFQHKLYDDFVKHLETIKNMNMDEMPDPDSIFNENETLSSAKKESMEGKEFDLIAPADDTAEQPQDASQG